MQLLTFEMTIKYRQVSQNNVADAISLLPTFGHTNIEPNLDIPDVVKVTQKVDTSSWLFNDWGDEAMERTPADYVLAFSNSLEYEVDTGYFILYITRL